MQSNDDTWRMKNCNEEDRFIVEVSKQHRMIEEACDFDDSKICIYQIQRTNCQPFFLLLLMSCVHHL